METARWSTALLTAAIETPLFYLFGCRQVGDCLWFALINVMSNLLLNDTLRVAPLESCFWGILLSGELVAVVLEFALCRCLLSSVRCSGGGKLFLVVLSTNLASFLCGVIWGLLLT
ncbi:MAG: hypothetical protein K6E38_05810 [Fretibacterium sp.]|nr:hypothetical protein [Fretibacterium sp.]